MLPVLLKLSGFFIVSGLGVEDCLVQSFDYQILSNIRFKTKSILKIEGYFYKLRFKNEILFIFSTIS